MALLALLLGSGAATAGSLVGEVYACYTHDMTPEDAAEAGITVVSHTPWVADPVMIKRCHELGIKVLPYVSPEKAEDRAATNAHASPYFRAVSPAQNREWIMVRGDGLPVHRNGWNAQTR
jgi:hypothetical protein